VCADVPKQSLHFLGIGLRVMREALVALSAIRGYFDNVRKDWIGA